MIGMRSHTDQISLERRIYVNVKLFHSSIEYQLEVFVELIA